MFESSSDPMSLQRGFSLIELITIVVILAILAVAAIPRVGNNEYRSNEFRDRTVSALRYAQKSAVSHRRIVCVTFTATTVALSMDTANNGAPCETALLLPGSNSAVAQSGDADKAYFTLVPANVNFASDGTSAGANIQINKQPAIVVNGVTGYVN